MNQVNEKLTGTRAVPETLLHELKDCVVNARITAAEPGVFAGTSQLLHQATQLGMVPDIKIAEGSEVKTGDIIASLCGGPVQIVRGEDLLIGSIAKASGVATAAKKAQQLAGNLVVVCGGWKKMPFAFKEELRLALITGGVSLHPVPGPFIYLDKNYIRILGSISAAIAAARNFPGRSTVVQLKGETAAVSAEALMAAAAGADVLMVDTGRHDDIYDVSQALRQVHRRQDVKLGFAGNIKLNDLAALRREDLDMVDIGRAILDAPLLDCRYDVFRI